MAKAYIIIMGWGEFSDRGTKPARVYLDRARAQDDMAKLESISQKYHRQIYAGRYFPDYRVAERLSPTIKAEYAAIGFDADWTDDWELAEAELDDALPREREQGAPK